MELSYCGDSFFNVGASYCGRIFVAISKKGSIDVTFLIKFPSNKCKHNKGQADVKLYMLFTKGSKEDAPIEKKDTKVAYQADKIENISKIQLIA